ncbi:MAG: alpha/beta hydrolase [Planctomycetales bacterium]|nr:alpha/beta hydrolase [Planctomycetales bacterium]
MNCFQAVILLIVLTFTRFAMAEGTLNVWPNLAPGETTSSMGSAQPAPANEQPPVTRIEGITKPTLTIHLANKPNGSGIVILPGGGFGKVVPDKEGTEAAAWLNDLGFAAFVLSYRTKQGSVEAGWERPLQDAQRAMALIRHRAGQWGLDQNRIGLLGFSAGGQVATRLLSAGEKLTYPAIDAVDHVSHWPNFVLLVYPWNIYDPGRRDLIEGISVPRNCPPTFLVHTDDDRSSSLGAILFYRGLKELGIPSELHVYGNGGHGYGLRAVQGSQISSWPNHAAHWLLRLQQN